MEDFAVDLDKVLDDFEQSEGNKKPPILLLVSNLLHTLCHKEIVS